MSPSKEAKIRFFSITVDLTAKLKVEKLARSKDRSESWVTEKAIDKIRLEDLD